MLLIVLSGMLKFASRGARMNLRAQDVLFFVLLFACFSTRLDLSIFWTYVSLILHSGALRSEALVLQLWGTVEVMLGCFFLAR